MKIGIPRFTQWLYYFFVIAGAIWVALQFMPDRWKPVSLKPAESKPAPSAVTILIFGIDAGNDTKRSDSIIVARLDVKRGHLGVLSIPRDTYVFVDGQGYTKINHSYMVGDNRLLVKTVSEFLGISIDFVVKFGLTGVVRFVDAIGGVSIDVPKAMNYDDNAGDLHIHIKKGYQKLDGHQALQFMRFRHDAGGDISRIRRQQDFLTASLNQVMTQYPPQKVYELLGSLSEYVYFDFSKKDVALYFPHLVHILNSGKVDLAIIPGVPEKKDGVYYWMTSDDEKVRVVTDVLYGGDSNLAPERLEY
jgi:LCP family protein required for cell wall assembly